MNDLLDTLHAARPTDDDLTAHWPAEQQNTLRRRALDPDPQATGTGRARTVRRALALAAAAAVAAVVVVPNVVGGQSAEARERLLELSAVAASADAPLMEPGTFLHVKSSALQNNSALFGDGERLDTDREAWVAFDGEQWRYDHRPSRGWTEALYFPGHSEDVDFGSPTPALIAGLPRDPEEFRRYLDGNVTGSNSHAQALFVAVADLLRTGMVPPATAAVAIESLVGVDGVETRDVVVDGREAVEISYARFYLDWLSKEYVTVDRATAQLLASGSSDPTGSYEETTSLIEVVERVPARIKQDVATHGNGTRICADGTEAAEESACP